MFASTSRYYNLFIELTKQEFSGRYRGSFGGLFWSFLHPLFLLSVYTIAFGVILKARWGFAGGTVEYAFMLFAGMIVFNAFSEVLTKSASLITSNPNFVKKVVFPLQILPLISTSVALTHILINALVWLAGYWLIIGHINVSILYFPLILLCLIPLLLGVGWLFSAAGVVVRDIQQITGMLNHTLLFLTPIFYSVEAAPPTLQKLLMLNPLTFIVEQFRLALFYGQPPALKALTIYFLFASFFALGSYIFFQRLRPNFADIV